MMMWTTQRVFTGPTSVPGSRMFLAPAGDSMSALSQYLNTLSYKQKMVSHNVSNAHTPGYRALEGTFAQVLSSMQKPFETSYSQTMGSMISPMWRYSTGHKVNLQDEFLEMQRILLNFNMVTRRLGTVITNLRTAAQTGR